MWTVQFRPLDVETSMDAITTCAWAAYQQPPYRGLGAASVPGRTLYCYAQNFISINGSLQRKVYHNVPEWQWRPIMRLATGRLNLHCVTAHWHGASRSVSDRCPCCAGCLEDPAHYVLECRGLGDIRAQYPALTQAAVVAATNGVRTAMLQLFRPMHFAQLANYLIRAQRRRFAVGGMDLMVAQAAEPPASMVATSPSRSASCSGGYSSDSGQGDDDDAWSDGA